MASARQGLFITLEGGEGSGKSTQAHALKALLEKAGRTVTLTREPAGCPLGQRVRELLSEPSLQLDARSELLLFVAGRAQHVAEVIRPALERGEVVICDRFGDSSVAYQGYGRGLSPDDVRLANRIATQGLVPDLTVLLDVPVETGLARKAGEDAPDRIGQEGAEFHQRVRQGYLALAADEPQRFLVVDATLAPEEITRTIWRWLEPLLA
ncbi:MAG: dTMP kinase [Dehalococcoidia bacterium]|nr:dTMP kinase [Dehalococcoidia bacterium]